MKGINVVQIHNFLAFTIDELEEIIKRYSHNGLVVGISTSFLSRTIYKHHSRIWERNDFEKIIKLLHVAKVKYGAITVIGGWMVYSYFIDWIKHFTKLVDLFVSGPGHDILESLCRNERVDYGIEDNMRIIHVPSRINDFTFHSSAPLPQDKIAYGESLFSELGSGCIFSCSFCSYSALGKKKTEFLRSYESLKEEIVSNYQNFGTTMYTFTDNIMNDYLPKLDMLIRIKNETGIDVKWVGYVRLDTIKNENQVRQIFDSGSIGWAMGIESFTKECGSAIGKLTDGERLKDLLRMVRSIVKDKVSLTGLFIAGLPYESYEQLAETYKWLISSEGLNLIDHYSFQRLILFPSQNNPINMKRGNPFNEYKAKGITRWSSPYGASKNFELLSDKFNSTNKKAPCFDIPLLHNVSNDLNLIPAAINSYKQRILTEI